MKTNPDFSVKFLCSVVLGWAMAANAALPSEWRYEQDFAISAPGLVKISLPVETLDTARPALEDLRLCDDAGHELSYLISRPVPAPKTVQGAKSFQVSLNTATTVITLETGLTQAVDGVSLETAAMNFIKAVTVEGSNDPEHWRRLVQGQPVFHQLHGGGQLHVSFPAGAWRWLRLTIDDQRTLPVPFSGARVYAADFDAAPVELQTASIAERNENPGETRLTVNLGAANLEVASLEIETDEPLFNRSVTIAAPQVAEDSIREQIIGRGVIYRVAVDGQPPSAELSVPLEARVHSRDLVLLIHNEDSPPLAISAVRVERRSLYLVFMARQAGVFHLMTGNKLCTAPHYDLAALGANLKAAVAAPVNISTRAENPDYIAPQVLGGLEVTGAALDVTSWKFRKAIQLTRGGAQQAELDTDVLAHAQPGLADLRVMRGSNQVPYILQRTSISRALSLPFVATNDAKSPRLSRWLIKLPKSNLPLTRLTCVTKTPLFQRTLSVFEEITDERGDTYRRQVGSATWTQTPESKLKEFSLPLDSAAQGDTLILETENGDNPPIELEKFTAFYPATRVLFKAAADDRLLLHYGNANTASPSYDLNLVAAGLLAADKSAAALGLEERLKKSSWLESSRTPAAGGILFWGILAVVVIGLLLVISRLLPKPPSE